MEPKIIDHLFRHQHGKMVSILTRIFGLAHLETIEDAVQDTFVQAMQAWRQQIPDNPEAWLTQAAKNRTIDLFRKFNAEKKRIANIQTSASPSVLDNLFLETEIEDAQLRMIFTACHPILNPRDQIAFALKTISGFSSKEIASALLLKEDTIKKSLSRARKTIQEEDISFAIPTGIELPARLDRVLKIIYLIFNEGFHSNKKDILIRKELCGEAIRLCKMLLKNELTNPPKVYALFALMCFHSARMPSRVNENNELLDLKNQDRSLWYLPLMTLGNRAMMRAVETDFFSSYHYEAAIAAEHLKAASFEKTDWDKILEWYEKLYEIQASDLTQLNIAMVQLQRNDPDAALQVLKAINPDELAQRTYLYHGAYAEYFVKKENFKKAIECINKALELVMNESERQFLLKKRARLLH